MRHLSANSLLVFEDEVREALDRGAPVVALESNVLAHGLRYPVNVSTALAMENKVRQSGAVPATITIDSGRIRIGLSAVDIERFGSAEGIEKVSSRDMGAALARGGLGATSVASSIVAADLAGIRFFASAGIGGVHRGGENTMDISADLIQFTRSRVAVVCAGAKNILDLGLTLEFLETHCVPVISYKSDDFPAFYCRSSGFPSPQRLDTGYAIALALELHWALGNNGGVLITSPTKTEDSLELEDVERVVRDAISAAEAAGIRGNGITREIMRAVDLATGGRSTSANIAALITTAETAAELAVAYANFDPPAFPRQSNEVEVR
ncbi:Pseudouridine-5'-phosphate glycosidase [Agrobacterium sp. DSM 25558]|uniref:pseudouridine-5'-phosphate glycosidase n=1 Tax=Agrobacterium sp. DSM 25558 TaxID=1907665 RepID=UPI000972623B|nr:pseudouridine-5'-phosphate glycosidase [Agrobacterium sp. DSM 25558]SCX28479.1 Pseudouridine-5'-phosphate glycosidase [Agrobacterium sp. DSM 25558]